MRKRAKPEALVIDPWDGEEILSWARGNQCHLVGVLNTHGHADHVRGNEVLLNHGTPLVRSHPWLQVVSVPGHTLDHVAFLLIDGDEQHFFAGDTLFQSGVGNCKGGGDTQQLFQTVQRLHTLLAEHTFIHPGHDYLERNLAFAAHVCPKNPYVAEAQAKIPGLVTHELPPSTWGEEKRRNPFLGLEDVDLRQRLNELVPDLSGVLLSDEICFKRLRHLRDNW
ncbi:MAG: hydroxyacylglutathione hydrolase C-terminal domain-containing protein [Bacteriovoracia bacterium]